MNELPCMGVGVSYRSRWREAVLASRHRLGCLEVIAEHYLNAPREKLQELDALQTACPLLPHGIGLSFGTAAPLDDALLAGVAGLVERIRPPWFTEHLAFTGAHGRNIGHLAPLPFTRESVRAVCRNVRHWREVVGAPLLLENITYDVELPGEMSEAEFLAEVTERSGCGLLLDLHNVYTNARNHGHDPFAQLAAFPLERVGQIHLGGGHDEDGYRLDSHDAAPPEPVWDMLRFVAERAEPKAVILEWDANLPPFDTMLADVERARSVIASAGGRTDGAD